MALPVALQHLTLPVIGAPLFIASGTALVAAQCKAGIVGSFPALNARPAELLDTWLTDIQAELAACRRADPNAQVGPIAVNQIVHQSNDRLAQDVEVCVKHRIPIINERLASLLKFRSNIPHVYSRYTALQALPEIFDEWVNLRRFARSKHGTGIARQRWSQPAGINCKE